MLSLDGTDYAAGTRKLPESGSINFAGLFAPPIIEWTIRVALPQDQLPGFFSLRRFPVSWKEGEEANCKWLLQGVGWQTAHTASPVPLIWIS